MQYYRMKMFKCCKALGIVLQEITNQIKKKNSKNKNPFQWDAYHPLVDCIPACTGQGVGVSQHALGSEGVCVSQHALGRGDMCVSQHALDRWGCLPQGMCLSKGSVCHRREGVGGYARHTPVDRQTPVKT